MPSRSVTVRWVSALPVKEALLKSKYGAAAGSADAKKMLEQPREAIRHCGDRTSGAVRARQC